jgi:hypothetical protein
MQLGEKNSVKDRIDHKNLAIFFEKGSKSAKIQKFLTFRRHI